MEIMVGAVSDKGNVKKVNQDNFLAQICAGTNGDQGIFIMCDGMGGLSKGEIASTKAVHGFKEWFDTNFKRLSPRSHSEDILSSLSQVLENVNKEIISYGLSIAERVGTTTSVLLIWSNNFYIVHIGDSRIYRLNRKIEQLTEDHTCVAMKVKNNLMTREEAKVNSKKNVLTQCIGVKENIEIFKNTGKIFGQEIFILCSDGFYNKLSEDEIVQALKSNDEINNDTLQETATKLVAKVMSRAERDNISVMLVGLNCKGEKLGAKINRFLNAFK